MINRTLKTMSLSLIFIISIMVLEIISSLCMGNGIFVKYPFFSLFYLVLLTSFFYIINNDKFTIIFSSVILVIIGIVVLVNINLDKLTGDVLDLYLIGVAQEGLAVATGVELILYPLLFIIPTIFIGIGALIVTNIFFKVKEYDTKRYLYTRLFSYLLCILVAFVGLNIQKANLLTVENTYIKDDAELYETFYSKRSAYQKFGTVGYYMISMSVEKSEEELSDFDLYLENQQEEQNDFFGVSKDNNVIYILMESWQWAGLNKELTPNLYNLLQNSLVFNNYSSKTVTNIAETYMLFGSVPLGKSIHTNYTNNVYDQSLMSLFKNNHPDSQIVAFHNNSGSFYNRTNAYPRLEFDHFVSREEMEIENLSPWDKDMRVKNDEVMFDACLESQKAISDYYMIPSDSSVSFMDFILTFSMHGSYVENYRTDLEDYYKLIDDYKNSGKTFIDFQGNVIDLNNSKIRTFVASAMDFDIAMGKLLDELEDKNLMDKTTIIMQADHYAYMDKLTHQLLGIEDTNNEELTQLYNCPAAIYDQKFVDKLNSLSLEKRNLYQLNTKTYNGDNFLITDKAFTVQDMLPTLVNILGFNNKSGWYLGYDLFSDKESVTVSARGGIFNDDFYTLDGREILNKNEYILKTYNTLSLTSEEWKEVDEEIDKFYYDYALYCEKAKYIEEIYSGHYFGFIN